MTVEKPGLKMPCSTDDDATTWVLVDLGGNIVPSQKIETVDGGFWLVQGKKLPAARYGTWKARQDSYRTHGYQVAILKNNTIKIF